MDVRKNIVPHLHPLFVHFPQSLFPVALFSSLIFLATGRGEFEAGGYVALLFGLCSAPCAIASGFLDWKLRYKGATTPVFRIKIGGSYLLTALAAAAAALRITHPDLLTGPLHALGWLYLSLLVACFATCVVLGYYGGRLVFH